MIWTKSKIFNKCKDYIRNKPQDHKQHNAHKQT